MKYDADSPLKGAIVAMNPDRVIGLDGGIPWHYSADLKRFKARTLDCTIIMGRRTWESIGKKPLPGRRNIVISRNSVEGAECYTAVEEAIDSSSGADTWIIGGGQIYAAALSWVTLLDITYVPDEITAPDAVRFPDVDWQNWKEVSRESIEDTPLENVIYHRRS